MCDLSCTSLIYGARSVPSHASDITIGLDKIAPDFEGNPITSEQGSLNDQPNVAVKLVVCIRRVVPICAIRA